LSERERQILGCLARGDSNKLIARELRIADATVKVHVKALLRKLRVTNRTQAAVFAIHNRERPARAREATEDPDEPYGAGIVDGSSGAVRSANRITRSVELRPFRPVPQVGKISGPPEPRNSREADCSDRPPTNALI
jgi:DNA-binding CsgD family transcriptional regulator